MSQSRMKQIFDTILAHVKANEVSIYRREDMRSHMLELLCNDSKHTRILIDIAQKSATIGGVLVPSTPETLEFIEKLHIIWATRELQDFSEYWLGRKTRAELEQFYNTHKHTQKEAQNAEETNPR